MGIRREIINVLQHKGTNVIDHKPKSGSQMATITKKQNLIGTSNVSFVKSLDARRQTALSMRRLFLQGWIAWYLKALMARWNQNTPTRALIRLGSYAKIVMTIATSSHKMVLCLEIDHWCVKLVNNTSPFCPKFMI